MKKWINKQTTIAFILGITIALSVPVAAATKAIKEAKFNTATSITVDGQAVPLELVAVTLDGNTNGSNYAPVKALAEAMGGTVEYDSTTKVIDVSTNTTAPTAETVSTPSTVATSTIETKLTPDEIKCTQFNGKWYVEVGFPTNKWLTEFKANPVPSYYALSPITIAGEEKWKTAQLKKFHCKIVNGKYYPDRHLDETIIDNIPLYGDRGSLIEYDYYVDTILPIVQN